MTRASWRSLPSQHLSRSQSQRVASASDLPGRRGVPLAHDWHGPLNIHLQLRSSHMTSARFAASSKAAFVVMALRAQPAGLVRFAAKSAAQPGKELLYTLVLDSQSVVCSFTPKDFNNFIAPSMSTVPARESGSASFGSRYVSLLRAAVRAGTVAQMFLEWLELIFTYGWYQECGLG